MKFSDIDFSAIGNLMNSLSEDDMNQIQSMASDMMKNMQPQQQEQEEETDYVQGLNLNEEAYQKLPGNVLDALENAWDMENFYDEDEKADYSAAVLFYSKAFLRMLRESLFPVFKNVLEHPSFANKTADMTVLNDYLSVLLDQSMTERLVEEDFGNEDFWRDLRMWLISLSTALSRAEFDVVSYTELQSLKSLLLDSMAFIQLNESV